MCSCREHRICQAQAGTIQENIREFTEHLPLEGWQLNIIVTTGAILAAYTALQILLWDYKVSTADYEAVGKDQYSSQLP